MSELTSTAEVFVTTEHTLYETSDDGRGKWFDLADYEDHAAFMAAACKYTSENLADGEASVKPYFPEFNISFLEEGDRENNFDVDALIGEDISPSLWFMLKLSDEDLQMLNAYHEAVYPLLETIEENYKVAKETFIGEFSDEEEFGKHYMKELGYLRSVPEHLLECIDYERAGDILSENTNDYNGYYFKK